MYKEIDILLQHEWGYCNYRYSCAAICKTNTLKNENNKSHGNTLFYHVLATRDICTYYYNKK